MEEIKKRSEPAGERFKQPARKKRKDANSKVDTPLSPRTTGIFTRDFVVRMAIQSVLHFLIMFLLGALLVAISRSFI